MTQALLLMDVQNGIVDRFGSDDAYLDRVVAAQELLRGNGEVVVTKKRVSAFAGSDLELVLRARDVTGLVLGGIATSGVVLSTVREAADRDYELTVLEDLCLDGDDEVHRVLTQKVFPLQADVRVSADWRP